MKYTKYEMARIIGARALQLSQGVPLLIKLSKKEFSELGYSTLKIAKLEFEKGVVPITVMRSKKVSENMIKSRMEEEEKEE